MFNKGDKVYHRGLKWHGVFIEYDAIDTDSATVAFIDNDGYIDERRISHSLLNEDYGVNSMSAMDYWMILDYIGEAKE
jgi:hypothetical protein